MITKLTESFLGTGGAVFIAAYFCSLLVIGWLAKRAQQEASLKDYYLAGGSLGGVSLFFTLYATQYSGNSLFGTPGQAYRQGFIPLAVAIGMMGIILVYSLFASPLHRHAKQHGFITVGDYIRWRFHHRALLIAVNTIVVIALTSYGLANFKVIGLLLESVSGGQIPFAMGILILALVMAIYESLGGMRGVVWTDVIQGGLLFIGSMVLFVLVYQMRGGVGVLSLHGFADEFSGYLEQQVNLTGFLSLILLTSFAAAMYPQAIQRIYAARTAGSLTKAYRCMFFMPLLTVVPMILIGISAEDWLPGLDRGESDRVVIHVIAQIIASYPAFSWMLVLYLCAVIASIMSTIDSALLTLGSTFTQDFLASKGELSQRQLHRKSRMLSWLLMGLMAILAIVLPQTIWALMIFKLELLIQLVPAIILGVRIKGIDGRACFVGICVGALVAIVLKTTAYPLPLLTTVPAGLVGVVANLIVVVIMSRSAKITAV